MDRPRDQRTSRRSSRRGEPDRLDTPAVVVLAVLVLGSVLALGSVPFWATWSVVGLALAGGVLGAMALPRTPKPVWALLALAAFSALQALPLPFRLLTTLSAAAAQTWASSQLPLGVGAPSHASLSIDPGASLLEASKLLAYAGTFLLAARVRGQRGSSWLTALVFGAGSGVALVTLMHGAVNAQAVYGIYEPTFKVMRFSVGPLLNSNNLAGYVSVGMFAGVALLLNDRSPLPPLVVAAGLLFSVSALVLSGSRGGLVATLVGAAALGLWLWRSGRLAQASPLLRAAPPIGAGLALALAIGSARNLDALTSLDVTRKVATWKWSLELLKDHLIFGAGRGAFETALPPYRRALEQDWTSSFNYAENFVIQWLADWGVLVGAAAACGLIGYCGWAWLRARSTPHRLALMTWVLVLLLQNLVDLGLELPSIAILAIVAMVAGGESVTVRRASERRAIRPRVLIPAAVGCLAWLAAAVQGRSPVDAERRALSEHYEHLDVKSAGARQSFRAELGAALRRHPGEPYFPLLGAIVAYRGRAENPLPWIARALERSPTNGRVHLTLAEIVARASSPAQAMLHLRLASQYDSTLAERAGRRAAALAPSVDVLREAIPDGRRGSVTFMAACNDSAARGFQLECFQRAAERFPTDPAFRTRHVDLLLAAVSSGAPDCAGERAAACTSQVEQSIAELDKVMPHEWQPNYYRARLLSYRGQHADAAKLLAETCPVGNQGNECARYFVMAAINAKSEELQTRAVDSYAARECGSPHSCASANEWLASQLLKSGHVYQAYVQSSRAAEVMPTANRWLGVADLALKAQRYVEARAAIARSDIAADATPQTRARGEALSGYILKATFARH